MVMHQQNDILEMILNKGTDILTPDREVNYFPGAPGRDQQLDFYDILDPNNESALFDSMDSFIDDGCSVTETVAETVEIPTTASSTSDSSASTSEALTSETQYFFQFPATATTDFSTIDLGYLTDVTEVSEINGVTFINEAEDLTDTESVFSASHVPSTPFSPTSPSYSLLPPTPDTASSTSCNVPAFVKEELKLAIRSKRLKEGKGDIKIEFVEPPPEKLTEEEELKRIEKREKNKMAAQKCREKKRILADKLEAETKVLQKQQNKYKCEIQKLLDEREQLMEIVRLHKTVCPRFRTQSANI